MPTRATAARTTTQRGLGWIHQQQRNSLLRKHVEGTPCWWCGEPMFKSQGLEADHSKSRAHGGTVADRLLHSQNESGIWCNRARGDGSRDHVRPAITGKHERPVDDRAHWCRIAW